MKKILITMALLTFCGGAVAELADGLYAAFDTSMGSFTCRLDYAEAPVTCANFAGLAEGSQSWIDPTTSSVRSDPFYDDLIFHRVIDGFMIQGGCPLGNGTSGPGYAFPDEFSTNLTHHSAGILSMANSGLDSNGSQFFITVTNTPGLNNVHSVFGEVVAGMDVVFNIGTVATDAGDRPLTNVTIEQIDILRIGTDAENFDPLALPLPEVMPLILAITNGLSGMGVVAATSNQCEQMIHSSTNLSDWALSSQKYWPSANGQRFVSVATNLPARFFRGVRIFYPQAIPGLSTDITDHQLEFTQGTNSIVFHPQTGGVGSCTVSGTPDEIISWEWHPDIRTVYIQVWTALGYNLVFQINNGVPGNGNWDGYYYNSGWNYMGEWSFTDTPPSP